MPGFFENIPYETARDAEALSVLIYHLRNDRKLVLKRHGVSTPEQLIAAIRAGTVPEHPAYEDYLAAAALLSSYDAAREALRVLLEETKIL